MENQFEVHGTDRLLISACTDESLEAFYESIERFKPIKKLTVFFDSENFLLTEYNLFSNNTHCIIENINGETLQFEGFLCGYTGEGPRATIKILKHLGMKSEDTEKVLENAKIVVDFSDDSYTIHATNATFFQENNSPANESRLHIPCLLDSKIVVSLEEKAVCMINPQTNNIDRLLNCLRVMKPYKIEYTYSSIPNLNSKYEFSNILKNRFQQFDYFMKPQVNLHIHGARFNVFCHVDTEELDSLMYIVYRSLEINYSLVGDKPRSVSKYKILYGLFNKKDEVRCLEIHRTGLAHFPK